MKRTSCNKRRRPATSATTARLCFLLLVSCTTIIILPISASNNAWNEYPERGGRPRRPPINTNNDDRRRDHIVRQPSPGDDTSQPQQWYDPQQQAAPPRPTAPLEDDNYNPERRHDYEDTTRRLPSAPPYSQYDDDTSNNIRAVHTASSFNKQYTPIHYQFHTKGDVDVAMQQRRKQYKDTDDIETDRIPVTWDITSEDENASRKPPLDAAAASPATTTSPRRDAVTRYMSTTHGRVFLRLSSGTIGYALGGFVGKSLINKPHSIGLAFSIIFLICTFLRNPYGELARALGLALIYALQRTQHIRKQYPTWPHIKAVLGAGPRRRFPRGTDNPWQSNPDDDSSFQMMYSVIAMALAGSMCGGNLPVIPTWMGALGGAGFFAFVTTTRSSRGDLARCMGMRVVALVEEVYDINSELRIMSKVAVVSGKIFDKMMILDRKHRIKDKIVSVMSWAYNQVSRTAAQAQSDMQEETPLEAMGDRRGDDSRGGRDETGYSRRDDRRQDDDRRRDDRREGDRRRDDRRQGDDRRGDGRAEGYERRGDLQR